MKWIAGVILAMVAGSAAAAPFCVVTSYGQNCYYYDMPSCERAAAQQRGACVVQDERRESSTYEPPRQSSGAPFCVVTGYGSQCHYYDAPSCQRAAQTARGACVVNPSR